MIFVVVLCVHAILHFFLEGQSIRYMYCTGTYIYGRICLRLLECMMNGISPSRLDKELVSLPEVVIAPSEDESQGESNAASKVSTK